MLSRFGGSGLCFRYQASARGGADKFLSCIGDFTLEKSDPHPSSHEFSSSVKCGCRYGANEVHLQFHGREVLVGEQCSAKGEAHGSVGQCAGNAAMDGPHRIVVPAINSQYDGDTVIVVHLNLEAQQIDDRGMEESIIARGRR